jgi:hypothetical protein
MQILDERAFKNKVVSLEETFLMENNMFNSKVISSSFLEF